MGRRRGLFGRVFKFKTGRGKRNGMIDWLCHRGKTKTARRGWAILDETLHSVNEGGVNLKKAKKYGNVRRIFFDWF